jgi:SAM-dependent methyltransferase
MSICDLSYNHHHPNGDRIFENLKMRRVQVDERSETTGPNLHFKKINLGCGFDIRPGYYNVDLNDFHSPDYVADISDLKEFPNDHYHEIIAQDVLEHMTRDVAKRAFNEWARLLSPGGIMKIRVPSLLGLLGLFKTHPWCTESHEMIVHLLYGTQAYNGDYHMAGFTPPILVGMAKNAGLAIVRAADRDGWLYDLEFSKRQNVTDEEFLHGAYFDILGRFPDAGGLKSYGDRMAKGMSRSKVEADMRMSLEARQLRPGGLQ